MSRETIEYHYGKHHQGYVNNLNNFLTAWHELEWKSLEEIVKNSHGWMYNNAAQIWNHNLFWNCLSPSGGGVPGGKLWELIVSEYWDFEGFKDAFSQFALWVFWSGWTWLVLTPENNLEIINTPNGENLLKTSHKTLLGLDVWEHSYYIDYRNARAKYLDAFWNLVNWEVVEKNLV